MAIGVYFQPKLLAVLFLGFSSGLPLALVGGTFSVWLADSGVDVASIGLFAYVSYPYIFKFVWSPLMDHVRLPLLSRLGQRRSWMLLAQVGLMISIWGLSRVHPPDALLLTGGLAVLIAFFSASQDIVIDAFRAEYLDKSHYAEGASLAVLGYRVGMLVSGAGALALADVIDWGSVYFIMGFFVLSGIVTIMIAGEPEVRRPLTEHKNVSGWVKGAIFEPFQQFIQSHPAWLLLLLFASFYAMSDGFIGFMANVFLRDSGYSKTEIAAVAKLYGFAATIFGAFLGAILVKRLGLWKALLIASLLQLVTNLGYLIITETGPLLWALILAISMDNLAAGVVTATAVTFLMGLCDTRYTATQYALLSSLAAFARITMSGLAGYVSASYGWQAMFLLSAFMGLPSLIILVLLKKAHKF